MVHIYNKMAKPMESVELHYPMIRFLVQSALLGWFGG